VDPGTVVASRSFPLTEKGEFILLSQLTSIPDLLRFSVKRDCAAVGFVDATGIDVARCAAAALLVWGGRGSSARKAWERLATNGENTKKTNIPAKKGRLFFMKLLLINLNAQYQKYHCLFYEFMSAIRVVKAGLFRCPGWGLTFGWAVLKKEIQFR
jgi:hypothetical protein